MIAIYKITDEISKALYVGYSHNVNKVLQTLADNYVNTLKPATNKLHDLIKERGSIKGLNIEVLERLDGKPTTDVLQARKAHYVNILKPALNTKKERETGRSTSPIEKLTSLVLAQSELITQQGDRINQLTRQIEQLIQTTASTTR